MPRRSSPDAPITLARLERCMDTLCRLMTRFDEAEAEKLVPLYVRLEQEIERRRSTSAVLASAQRRVRTDSPPAQELG